MHYPFDFEAKLKQVIQDFPSKRNRCTNRSSTSGLLETGFPIRETFDDFYSLTPLQREIHDQILKYQRQAKMHLKSNGFDGMEFPKKIPWDTCVLNADQKGT